MKKVKVGIAGCGVVATVYYLPYLMKMPEAEITAVCDIYEERTAACVRLFGAREQYRDYYEMIRRADIDAVFILTGPGRTCRSPWPRSRRTSMSCSKSRWRSRWPTPTRSPGVASRRQGADRAEPELAARTGLCLPGRAARHRRARRAVLVHADPQFA